VWINQSDWLIYICESRALCKRNTIDTKWVISMDIHLCLSKLCVCVCVCVCVHLQWCGQKTWLLTS
jgi:hypothetical protein